VLLAIACSRGTESDEVTTYPIFCDGTITRGECSGRWVTANRSTYKVFPDRQEVVHWLVGMPLLQPERHKRCVVGNIENWECAFSDGSASFGFRDGRYYERPQPKGDDSLVYVSEQRWEAVRRAK
jgi:hypothetical protein